MPFKSSKAFEIGKLLLSQTSKKSILGQSVGGGGPSVPPVGTISGGDVDALAPGNGYIYNTFTSPGTLTVSGGDVRATILLFGGGGGGGGGYGGGGGAGGAVFYDITLEPGTYPVTIGAGGAGGADNTTRGSGGTPSTFGPGTPVPIVANGGGSGGAGGFGGPGPGGGGGCGGGSAVPYSNSGGTANQITANPSLLLAYGFNQFGSPGGSSALGISPGGPGVDGAGGGGGIGGAGGNGRYKRTPTGISLGTDSYGGGDGLKFNGFDGPLIGVPALAPLNGYFGGGGAGRAAPAPSGPAPSFYGVGGDGGGARSLLL